MYINIYGVVIWIFFLMSNLFFIENDILFILVILFFIFLFNCCNYIEIN